MIDLSTHLKIVGGLLLFLAVAHIFFPRRFGWREDMAKLVLLNRQIFFVHFLFIILILAMFGTLSLVYTELLIERGGLARVVLWGLTAFWSVRLIAQIFIYDSQLWRGNRFNTFMHILFTIMWSYYIVVYGTALMRQYE